MYAETISRQSEFMLIVNGTPRANPAIICSFDTIKVQRGRCSAGCWLVSSQRWASLHLCFLKRFVL